MKMAADSCNAKKLPGTIITIGGYGYSDVGDESMPMAFIRNLQELLPSGPGIIMLSPFPDATRQYHGMCSDHDIVFSSRADDIKGLNTERDRYLRWTELFIKNRILAWLAMGLSSQYRFYKLLRQVSRCSALVNVGGGNINSIMRRELYKRCTMHAIAHRFSRPVFVSGQTIGPFCNDNDRFIAMDALRNAAVITFRDKDVSRETVASLGVTTPVMYDAGDDAFSLKKISRDKALDLIRRDAGKTWDALECDYVWAINLKASLRCFKGEGRSGSLSHEIDLTARIIEYILGVSQSKILLVSTDFSKTVDDRVILAEAADRVDPAALPRVALLRGEYTPQELKGIIATCDFALGARYHFAVFALSETVPAICMASGEYQQRKLSGLMALLDVAEYYIATDMEFAQLDDVRSCIDAILQDREKLQHKLRHNVPPLMRQSTKIIRLLAGQLAPATQQDGQT